MHEQTPIKVRIAEDPEFLASPIVADYDVIFLHFFTDNHFHFACEKEMRENLEKLAKQGKGLMLIHLACGAFKDWPEFVNLAGKVWDRETGHDPRGPFQVRIAQKEHPITRGMQDFQADDELYTCLVGDRPVEAIATAHSKVMNKDYPMAFVFEYGKGRVFHMPLGHDVRAIEMPGVGEVLRRGAIWAGRQQP
jgi:type 1 glutamine amidotransferase